MSRYVFDRYIVGDSTESLAVSEEEVAESSASAETRPRRPEPTRIQVPAFPPIKSSVQAH